VFFGDTAATPRPLDCHVLFERPLTHIFHTFQRLKPVHFGIKNRLKSDFKPWKCINDPVTREPRIVDGKASVLAVTDRQQARAVNL